MNVSGIGTVMASFWYRCDQMSKM